MKRLHDYLVTCPACGYVDVLMDGAAAAVEGCTFICRSPDCSHQYVTTEHGDQPTMKEISMSTNETESARPQEDRIDLVSVLVNHARQAAEALAKQGVTVDDELCIKIAAPASQHDDGTRIVMHGHYLAGSDNSREQAEESDFNRTLCMPVE